MKPQFYRVSVVGTGSFLPGDPIPNDRIDEILGPLTEAPPRIQGFVKNIASRMLASSGVEYRHFAIHPETHELTHTVAGLAEEAARRALDAAGRKPSEVDLLLLSAPNYDQTTPPTSTLLQERLGIPMCAEMEVHSNCAGVGKCMQIAFDSLRTGRYNTALVTYANLSSVYLRNCYFNQEHMNKNQAALRYILADGSGAVFLERTDKVGDDGPVGHELLGTYVESVGADRQPGMTAGGGVCDLLTVQDQIDTMHQRGTHHLDQDFSAVNRDAGRLLFEGVVNMVEALGLDRASVSNIVASIPTRQLYEDNVGRFMDHFGVSREQAKFRARNTGYCGGASVLLHFDEMVRTGEIEPGQTVILHSVESSKWMTAGFAVRW